MLRLPVLAWLRLARVFQKFERGQNLYLRSSGLNTAQFDVLAQVGAHQGITQQQLADLLLVTKGNISQLLDRMEKQGLLRRTQEQKRCNSLLLTEKGQQLHDQVVPEIEQWVEKQMTALAPSEVTELLRLLRKLDQASA